MSHLRDHFDRIAIISLPEREERRVRLRKNLFETNLATAEDLTWVEAVNGRESTIPDWWHAGAGAWGCRFSQLKVLKEAQRDGLQSVLILEDDATFHPRSREWLTSVMRDLPADWEQLFLGGEYMAKPEPTASPFVLKGNGIARTHAHAVHHSLFEQLIATIANDTEYQENHEWQVDHQLSWHHQQGHWTAYAPAWWIAGQEEGETDIAKGSLPRRWWQLGLEFWKLPFVHLPEEILREELYWPEAPASRDPFELALWFRRAAFEAWSQGRLPALKENLFSGKEVRRYWPAGLKSGKEAEISALADYPANSLFEHPFNSLNPSLKQYLHIKK